jgi:diguanylate cyclase
MPTYFFCLFPSGGDVPAKTGSFAKRLYPPRVIGSVVGFLAVAGALYQLNTPAWIWVVLVAQGFVWPHLAYLMARHVPVPYVIERRHLLFEAGMGGLWVTSMQFNALPTTMLVSMLAMNCIAVGGPALLYAGLGVFSIALMGFTALLKPDFAPQTSHLQVYACLPMLAVYPLAVGGAAYRLAAKLARHKRAFRDFSRLDSLTGLLNQGAWRAELDDAFQSSAQVGPAMTLVLIDIDYFKSVNDSHGHLAGDEVIKLVGQVLQASCRPEDTAGRMGGDEFSMILRHTGMAQARVLLAEVQRQLQATFLTRAELPVVSLSMGVVEFAASMGSVEDWIRAADDALYSAKNQGRNQIVGDALRQAT